MSVRETQNVQKTAFHSKNDGQIKIKVRKGIFSLENNKEPCDISSSMPGTADDLQQTSERQDINRKPEIDIHQNGKDNNKPRSSCETECDFLTTDKKDEIASKIVEEELSTPVVLEEFKTSSPTMQLVDEESASKAEPDYNKPPEEMFFSRFYGCDKASEDTNVSGLAQREVQEPKMPVSDEVILRVMKEEPIDLATSQHNIQCMTGSSNLAVINEKVKKTIPEMEVVKADMSTTAMDKQPASSSMQEVTLNEEKPVIVSSTCEDNPSCATHATTSPSREDAQQTHKKGDHLQVRDKQSSTEATCNLPDSNNNAQNANISPPVEEQGTDIHSKYPPSQDDSGKVLTSNGSNEETSPSLNDFQDMTFTPVHGEESMDREDGKGTTQEEPNKENQGNCRKSFTLVVQLFVI